MSDRVRAVRAGTRCEDCYRIAWGGELWHWLRGRFVCPDCHPTF